MKRVLVVLALLVVAASAFAVSGKIYMRYGLTGPMYSYWPIGNDGQNNVDLWQGKDGTGFDVNTETIGITYRARPGITLPYNIIVTNIVDTETGGYNGWGSWDTNRTATSPGYLQFRDIKVGNIGMTFGIAWWQMFANSQTLITNTNNVTNRNTAISTTYNRVYIDYKFVMGLGDSIVIKQVDWEQMHFQYDYASQTLGRIGQLTNNFTGGSTFLAHIPLRVMITMDRLNIDLSPKFTYFSVNSGYNITGNSNVQNNYSKWRAGATVAISYGLSDSLSVYVQPGFFYTMASTFNTTLGWFGASRGLITNANSVGTITELPIFAGLKVKVGPGITMMLGYGFNFATAIDINNINSNTNKTETAMPRYAFFKFNWATENTTTNPTEFNFYGDTFMDFGFLKFGGDIAFAQNWTLGLQAGVGLNDKWSYWYDNMGTRGTTTIIEPTQVTADYGAQLFSFQNLMNYDNNMYIKYEDNKVAIKGTLFDRTSTPAGKLLGLFSYVDFTIKF